MAAPRSGAPSSARRRGAASSDPDEKPTARSWRLRDTMATSPDPQELLRSPGYVKLLVLAALIGVPVSAAAYGFLELVSLLQDAVFDDLPDALGFDTAPAWWP